MARFDSNANGYEWSLSPLAGGHLNIFQSTLIYEPEEEKDRTPANRATPTPKKVTRKIRSSFSVEQHSL
jgi:hypothetical protein